MAAPNESLSPWYTAAVEQIEREPNPVVTPYKRAEARTLYDQDGVLIETRNVTLQNGLVYPVTSSRVSRQPEGLEGLSHVEGVAWMLRPDQQDSIYQQRLATLGKLGVEGTVIGIPQNFGTWIGYDDNIDNMAGIFVNEAFEYGRDPSVAKKSGVSQAAMNGTGLIVRGKRHHNINTVDAHLNVLCLPEGVRVRSVKDVGRVGMQLWETISKIQYELRAVSNFVKLDRKSQKQLLATADISLSALYTQPQMLRSLLSGKTGEYAKELPEETLVVAELYDKDALSRARRWVRIFGKKASVAMDYCMDSAHVDCVSEIKQSNWTRYQTASVEVMRENPQLRSDPENIGAKFLTLMREQHPEFTKSNVPASVLR